MQINRKKNKENVIMEKMIKDSERMKTCSLEMWQIQVQEKNGSKFESALFGR